MSARLPTLFGLALLVAACGNASDPVADGDIPDASTQPTAASASPSRVVDSSDASIPTIPEDDLVFKPVPMPVQPPGPKPVRPLPTPPPPRRTQSDPVVEPVEALIASATADLAARLGVGAVAIEVLDARGVTWRDDSIGCPQPGKAYTEALEPGWLVTLRVDDASFRYHASQNGEPFYCTTPQGPVEGSA